MEVRDFEGAGDLLGEFVFVVLFEEVALGVTVVDGLCVFDDRGEDDDDFVRAVVILFVVVVVCDLVVELLPENPYILPAPPAPIVIVQVAVVAVTAI